MASHKTVTTHRASKKTVTATRTAVTLATATVGSIALVPNLAQATPNQSLTDVQNKVKDLQNQAEVATEAYNQANTQLVDLQHKVDQIQSRITLEQQALGQAQSSLGTLAAAQYKSGGVDSTLQLMLNTSPDAFLQQATALNEVTSQSASSLKNAEQIERQLQQDKDSAAKDLAELQKTRDYMAAQQAEIKAKQKAAQDLLNALTPTQRVQYNHLTSNGFKPPSSLPPATNPRAAAAVAFAKAQLGKPYVYGAAGPNAFDCSGLTMAAWAQAGVSMSHSSSDQYYDFPHVSESQLQPGDLVIYYATLHHVGIYVGNGVVIHAPHTGAVVEYTSLHSMPVAGYVRP